MTSDRTNQVARAQSDDGRPVGELIDAYRAGPRRLLEAVAGMDGTAMRARPIEGMMSTLEVLSHVADCEQFLADRMKRTAATDTPTLMGVDATPYLEVLHYQDRDPDLQLLLVDVTRRQMADDLARLEEEAWARTARHSETGVVTLRQLLFHAVRHLEYHVDTIAAKRAALGL
jgi:uncharacterized damage-inducible protein DinB